MQIELKPYKMREYLLVATTKHQLPFETYKLLAEWLSCYQYIYPLNRSLKIKPKIDITKPRDCLIMFNLCDIYYTTMLDYELVVFANTTGKGVVELCGNIQY